MEPLYGLAGDVFATSQIEFCVSCTKVSTGLKIVSVTGAFALDVQLNAVITLTVYGMPPPATLSTSCPLTPDTVATRLPGNVFCPLNHWKVKPEGFCKTPPT